MGYRGETQHDLYLMKMRVRMDRFYIESQGFCAEFLLTALLQIRDFQYGLAQSTDIYTYLGMTPV